MNADKTVAHGFYEYSSLEGPCLSNHALKIRAPLFSGTLRRNQIFVNRNKQSESLRLKIPRPDKESAELFRSLVPEDDRVRVRPMFGNISAFVNGNMFFGVFGSDLFLRLSGEDQGELLKNKGASMLEPMKGRPMKDYVIVPKTWRDRPEILHPWISKSLKWSSKLPPKKTKK
jgi:TfoX/Sxy family transcriptional regulator of competence genes